MRGLFSVIGVAALIVQVCCLQDSYWVKISGPITTNDKWIELRVQSPLKAEKDYQDLILELDPPFKDDMLTKGKGPDAGKGILSQTVM